MDHIAIINWSESVLNARKRAAKALGSDRQKIGSGAALKSPQHCIEAKNKPMLCFTL